MVVGRYATLQEIDTHYTYMDLLLANEAIDIRDEAEYLAHKAAEARAQTQGGYR